MRIFVITLFSLVVISCSTKIKDTENMSENHIPAYLDSVIPFMEDFYKSSDSIYSNIRSSDEYGYYLYQVGRFIDNKEIYAINYVEEDTLVNFYHFEKDRWKLVGSQQSFPFEIFEIEHVDMDNDNRNEIILKSHFNMNGNTWQEVFYCSKKDGSINHAGSFTTEYTIDKEKRTVVTDYGGSWWMTLIRGLYRWHGEKLILEKEITLRLKEVTMECDEYILSYYENTPLKSNSTIDSLTLIYEIPYMEKKHQHLWDNFFDEKIAKTTDTLERIQ